MAKRFKLKLTIPSFQLCRSKKLSNFPGNPVPAIYRLSPVNTKARDAAYPYMPDPPPTTPENHDRFRFCKMEGDKGKKVESAGGRRSVTTSVSSRRSNFPMDQDEESESLISGLNSLSDEFDYHEAVRERETSRHVVNSAEEVQRQRFRRSEMTSRKKTITTTRTSAAGSMTQRTVEGKVKESFAVVKRSKDPYEDFKKSMLEMIMEMEMFEARDLEQLLQSFLTLNSRHYHGVIARAFMEIWQELFSEPRAETRDVPVIGIDA